MWQRFLRMLLLAAAAAQVGAFELRGAGRTSSGTKVLQPDVSTDAPKPRTAIFVGISSTLARTRDMVHKELTPLRVAAVVTTVALQLSPMRSSMEIWRNCDVKRYDGYPYFSVLTGAMQWCVYGASAAHFSGNWSFFTMVQANAPGVTFGIFYIAVFLRFVPSGDPRKAALLGYLKFLIALLALEVAGLVVLGSGAIWWLGLTGAIGSAQIALSPFKTLPEVVRTRSTKSWPVDLCLWSFIQSVCTGGFGVAASDPWVWVPNLIGVIGAGIQLILVAILAKEVSPNEKAPKE